MLRKTLWFLWMLLLSLVFILLILPKVYGYFLLSDYNNAKYNLRFTGPIESIDYLKEWAPIEEAVGEIIIFAKIQDNIGKSKDVTLRLINFSDYITFSELSFFNLTNLLDGSFVPGKIVVSQDIADKLKKRIGDPIQLLYQDQFVNVEISGIMKNTSKVTDVLIGDLTLLSNNSNLSYTEVLAFVEPLTLASIVYEKGIAIIPKNEEKKLLIPEIKKVRNIYNTTVLLVASALLIIIFYFLFSSYAEKRSKFLRLFSLSLIIGLFTTTLFYKIFLHVSLFALFSK